MFFRKGHVRVAFFMPHIFIIPGFANFAQPVGLRGKPIMPLLVSNRLYLHAQHVIIHKIPSAYIDILIIKLCKTHFTIKSYR